MIAIYSAENNYQKGDSFPLFTIPSTIEGEEKMNFADFQWWAYSEDFQVWLDKNQRTWKAESVDYSIFSDSINEWDTYEADDKKALSFSEYSRTSKIFEDEEGDQTQEPDKNTVTEGIKFHFAYNKLLSEGKINDSLNFSSSGDDLAVFVAAKDDAGNVADVTLHAFRMQPKNMQGSKIALVEVNETLPGGPLPQDATAITVIEKIYKNGVQLAAWGAVGMVIFGIIKVAAGVGGTVVLNLIFHRRLMRSIKGTTEAIKNIGKMGEAGKEAVEAGKFAKGIKSLWGGVRDIKILKNTRSVIRAGNYAMKKGVVLYGQVSKLQKLKNFYKGAKWSFKIGSKSAKAAKEAAAAAKVAGKVAGKTASKGARFIPFVGEVLLAIDLIGGSYFWLRNNQAPTYNEVKSVNGIMDHFNPSEVEIGRPITVCYSQGSDDLGGIVLDTIVNTEKRTTMQLVKISEDKNGSIFIVSQINSEHWSKELAKYDLFLLRFPTGTNVKRHWYDNEDLKPMGSFFGGLAQAADAPFVLQGYCNWNELLNAYTSAEDQLLKADPSAPATYDFNFKDGEGNVMNVSGKKISSETLSKLTDEQLKIIFGIAEVGSSATNESQNYAELSGRDILKFNSFHNRLNGLYENEENTDVEELTPQQKSGSAYVAAYNITKKEYANPDLRGKKGYGLGQFEHFLIGSEAYSASEGTPVEIAINTDEMLNDCRAGIGKFEGAKEVKTGSDQKISIPDDKTSSDLPRSEVNRVAVEDPIETPNYEREPKSPGYDLKVSPNDVKVNSTRRATTISDSPVPNGINLFDKFLTTKDKEILGISGWKSITSAKEIYDRAGNIIEVKIRNGYAKLGDRKRSFNANDGESFEVAKRFVEEARDRIKIE